MRDVKPGVSFTISTEFYTEEGTPLVLTTAPSFAIRDSSQNLVLSGIASQTNQAQRWQADISLPDNIEPGSYSIVWIAQTTKSKQINREVFNIIDSTPNYYELDVLVPEKSSVTDVLKAESGETIESVTAQIITPEGSPIYSTSSSDITSSTQGDKQVFTLRTPLLDQLYAGGSAFALYIINWNFTANGEPQTEHHFVYVVNPKVLAYVNELKRMIDKAGIQNPNVSLRYNNVDLVAYLNQGVQWLNIQPPQQTAFTLADVPNNLYIYVLYSAAVHALESRLMAEAEAAFNFSGQPIQLEVDRTPFLESAIGRYNDKLNNVDAVKKIVAMSGGSSGGGMGYGSAGGNDMGILGLSIGPMVTLSILPQFNSRVAGYNDILNYLGYRY